MASSRQVELFRKLTDDRQFPGDTNIPALRSQFADLPDANASTWIERALELPKKGDDDSGPRVPPPF